MNTIQNDNELKEYARSLAHDILDDVMHSSDGDPDYDEAFEMISDYVDASEHVIYTSKAMAVCFNCVTTAGEYWLEDIYENPFDGCESFANVCERLAYAVIRCEVGNQLRILINGAD